MGFKVTLSFKYFLPNHSGKHSPSSSNVKRKEAEFGKSENLSGLLATGFSSRDRNKASLALLISTVSSKCLVTWEINSAQLFAHDLLDALQSLSVHVLLESYCSFVGFQTYIYP